jgi:hypothetical protein
MSHRLCGVLVLAVVSGACGSSPKPPPPPAQPAETGGTGTPAPMPPGGFGAGGSGGSPPAGTAGEGGAPALDAAAPGGSGGAAVEPPPADASPPGDATPTAGALVGFYEAEAVPPNQVIAGAVVGGCGAATPVCGPYDTVKPEDTCCFGGKEVRQLLRGKGGLQFNGISAPADGMYDVTWWYHCGNNDNFHDPTCRGEPHTPAGCRPGQVVVNGVTLPRIFEFPCFPGSWGQIHAATTPLPLKAGATNTIKMTAGYPINDAIDIDAIAIYPAGKGLPPTLPRGAAK